MMNLKPFSCIFLCIIILQSTCIGNSPFTSNPSFGTGVIQTGLWSILNNPAGLSNTKNLSAGAYYEAPFMVSQLATAGFAISVPFKNSSACAFGYRQFGYTLYKEHYAALAYSRSFGDAVQAAVRLDYLSIVFGSEYGKSSAFTGSAGVQVQVSDQVKAGLSVFNPARVKISADSPVRYPIVMEAGASWSPGKHLQLSVGVEKRTDEKEFICLDVLYLVSSSFSLRIGVDGGVKPFYFGYGFRIRSMEIGMISGYDQLLGFSPQFSLVLNRH